MGPSGRSRVAADGTPIRNGPPAARLKSSHGLVALCRSTTTPTGMLTNARRPRRIQTHHPPCDVRAVLLLGSEASGAETLSAPHCYNQIDRLRLGCVASTSSGLANVSRYSPTRRPASLIIGGPRPFHKRIANARGRRRSSPTYQVKGDVLQFDQRLHVPFDAEKMGYPALDDLGPWAARPRRTRCEIERQYRTDRCAASSPRRWLRFSTSISAAGRQAEHSTPNGDSGLSPRPRPRFPSSAANQRAIMAGSAFAA